MPYTDTQIARVAHAAVMELQAIQGDLIPSLPWDWESPDVRESAAEGVRFVREREVTPAENHQHWVETRTAQGWSYGPVKDPLKKTHPSMVAYEELPDGEKEKNRLFIGIVTALGIYSE